MPLAVAAAPRGPGEPTVTRARPVPVPAGEIDDDALLAGLYAEHAQPLLRLVVRLTGGDRQRAEDIVQEVIVRAWRNIRALGPSGVPALRPWLVTVARRIAIDAHRRDRVRPIEAGLVDGAALSVPDESERIVGSMVVIDALRTLGHPHRQILVETYFRGRTVTEAAEVLGLPLGTAKSRLYYAMRALRVALEQQGVTG
jgi:RNA polymerase sigma-70 factor (ECF subfamily)